jgi:subfamily B ATP-binding cassette protein MsbA
MFDPEATDEKIKKACLSANIWEFVSGTEDGLQTKIGDRGIRLSGGQRQRLSIARELYKLPDLLILDEATSALDAESESVIKEAIESLKGKMTVVIIAHRLSTIKHADKVYVMDKGKIVESGSYAELIQSKNKFHQMVEMQSL